MVHIYNGILLIPKKKNEIVPLAENWMHLETITESKVREKQVLYTNTDMWNLENDTDELPPPLVPVC